MGDLCTLSSSRETGSHAISQRTGYKPRGGQAYNSFRSNESLLLRISSTLPTGGAAIRKDSCKYCCSRSQAKCVPSNMRTSLKECPIAAARVSICDEATEQKHSTVLKRLLDNTQQVEPTAQLLPPRVRKKG